ncbi:uncharacterized protein LOC129949817 [Eupeodes corollae]|uniref:uncharacterized protein LOC129949817 n=1 Tax=Eupeodes corollae TaxID=290404 RepID=UPI0024907716|nr:uncharacterized protein LOC129949817 [Eupeodes corollae]
MSKNADYSVKELSENAFFVQILSNYPNMFQRPITKSERARQEYARYALTHTFNEKCKTNLTIKQISRKINNMKARLKDKNARHLLGAKTVKYHDWERLFLKLWTGVDHFPLQFGDETENTETSTFQNAFNPENISCNSTDYYSYKTNQQKSPTTPPSPTEFKTKIEPEVNDIESVSDVSNAPHWKIEVDRPETTEPPTDEKEEQFNDIHNVDDDDDDDDDDERDDYMDDDDYEKMSMEKLRRIALISQTKMYKAQESAARSKEKLNEYKLMILKRTHEGNLRK